MSILTAVLADPRRIPLSVSGGSSLSIRKRSFEISDSSPFQFSRRFASKARCYSNCAPDGIIGRDNSQLIPFPGDRTRTADGRAAHQEARFPVKASTASSSRRSLRSTRPWCWSLPVARYPSQLRSPLRTSTVQSPTLPSLLSQLDAVDADRYCIAFFDRQIRFVFVWLQVQRGKFH